MRYWTLKRETRAALQACCGGRYFGEHDLCASKKIVDQGIENITTLQSAIDSASAERLLKRVGEFDLIVASSVCSFLPDYEASLRCLRSVMKPEGYFVQWDWLADMSMDRIRNAYDSNGLKTIAVEEDFAMAAEESPMPVVVGLAQSPT